jgi:hypothetical protein
MSERQWPSSQQAWDLLAADVIAAQRAERTAHWKRIMDEDQADADLYEPLSPEEEETLF